jgi:hypothetical protein
MYENPSFVLFELDWIWFSRKMLVHRWKKPEDANELRALVGLEVGTEPDGDEPNSLFEVYDHGGPGSDRSRLNGSGSI